MLERSQFHGGIRWRIGSVRMLFVVRVSKGRTTASSKSSSTLPGGDQVRKGVAMCLSGGGYRAALFHVGALRRLNELGVLIKITTFCTVSGGSILAGQAFSCSVRWALG